MPLLRTLDLFTGVGGITLALDGICKPLLYCDINPDVRAVLTQHIAGRRLPAAPIVEDVRDVTARAIRGLHRGAGKAPRVDLVVAGSPCTGFSTLGKGEGFENAESRLFYEVMRIVDETRPPLVFLENVVGILRKGMGAVVTELHRKRGYELRWCLLSGHHVGAPQQRMRWFCLAVRPGFRCAFDPRAGRLDPHPWAGAGPTRMDCGYNDNDARYAMMGNSVIPQVVRLAFMRLASAFAVCRLSHAEPVRLEASAAPPEGMRGRPIAKDNAWPKHGILLPPAPASAPANVVFLGPRPPTPKKVARFHITLDPKAYRSPKPPSPHLTLAVLPRPVTKYGWATPRRSMSKASRYITRRTCNDLETQLRFERGTPGRQRPCLTSPGFLEWLMGFPRGWTSGGKA